MLATGWRMLSVKLCSFPLPFVVCRAYVFRSGCGPWNWIRWCTPCEAMVNGNGNITINVRLASAVDAWTQARMNDFLCAFAYATASTSTSTSASVWYLLLAQPALRTTLTPTNHYLVATKRYICTYTKHVIETHYFDTLFTQTLN